MNGRDFAIALGVLLLVGVVVLFVVGSPARAAMRDIARRTEDMPDSETEPTG